MYLFDSRRFFFQNLLARCDFFLTCCGTGAIDSFFALVDIAAVVDEPDGGGPLQNFTL